MMENERIDEFFNRSFEQLINKKMQSLFYNLNINEIKSYCLSIISIPTVEFLKWLDVHSFVMIGSGDMIQISKFNDAFYNVITLMINDGDRGYKFAQLGQMLQNDGIVRKNGANTKYGENHAKAAAYLGYAYSIKGWYFASCLGYVLPHLTDDEKDQLFVKLLIRTNLFRIIYRFSKNQSINFRSIFDILTDSTYKRRLHGTKMVLNMLLKCKDYDFSKLLKKIIY